MARIANKYLPIHQIDPDNPNLFLAQLIGAKDFRRDILLRIITEEKEWNEQFLVAKRCAHLHHSNVLQVLDVGQHGDFWYIAYEICRSFDNFGDLTKQISHHHRAYRLHHYRNSQSAKLCVSTTSRTRLSSQSKSRSNSYYQTRNHKN